MRLRSEIVNFGGAHIPDDGDEGMEIGEITIVEEEVLSIRVTCISLFLRGGIECSATYFIQLLHARLSGRV